jgi:hypothetical protein
MLAVLVAVLRERGGRQMRCLVLLGGATLVLGLPQPGRADLIPITRAEQDRINQAIDAGVEYLQRTQRPTGTWAFDPDSKHAVGYAALPGLALLESGVSVDAFEILQAAAFVRSICLRVADTYDISLAILFLDRLGKPTDRELIQRLAVRLIAGQTKTGGWSYRCPLLKPEQHAMLLAALREPAAKGPALPNTFRRLPVLGDPTRPLLIDPEGQSMVPRGTTDNSNTQFATLALWRARRHGVPMERSLRLIAYRFATSQNWDGSWGYRYRYLGGVAAKPAMTGVGLLGLAVGRGIAQEAGDKQQPAACAAAAVAGAFAGPPLALPAALDAVRRVAAAQAPKRRWADPKIIDGFRALNLDLKLPPEGQKDLKQRDLYFLWSVERVAMLYDQKTIGGKDWYRWGMEMLLANQQPDGNWQKGGYPGATPTIDTCFALLFLKRADLVQDLRPLVAFNPNLPPEMKREMRAEALGSAEPNPSASPDPAPHTPRASSPEAPAVITITDAVSSPTEALDEAGQSRPWVWMLGAGGLLILLGSAGVLGQHLRECRRQEAASRSVTKRRPKSPKAPARH